MNGKKHIMLAEDQETTRTTFTSVLQRAGYEVTPVPDGRIALSKILALEKEGRQIDLLITDIRMEGLDGLQLTDQLEKLRIRVPVLAITGYGDKDLVVELMRHGCSDYLEKPFEAMELLEKVAKVFRKIEQGVPLKPTIPPTPKA